MCISFQLVVVCFETDYAMCISILARRVPKQNGAPCTFIRPDGSLQLVQSPYTTSYSLSRTSMATDIHGQDGRGVRTGRAISVHACWLRNSGRSDCPLQAPACSTL